MLVSYATPGADEPAATDFGHAFWQLGYRRGQKVSFVSLAPSARDVLEVVEEAFPSLLDRGRAKPVWLDHLVDGRTAQQADSVIMARYLLRHLPKGPIEDDPFGQAPWPCFNPLSEHHGQRVVYRRDRLRLLADGLRRARFYCDCGYSYTYAEKKGGTLKSTTLRAGPLLATFVQKAALDKLSITAAAKRVGIDPKTLYRLGVREGIDMPWKRPAESIGRKRR